VADTFTHVVLPELGESISEGSVTAWRKRVGDPVVEGEPLVDVTTDKVDVEIPAPAAGTLAKILVEAGQNVRVGASLAEIDTSKAAPNSSGERQAQPSADAEVDSVDEGRAATAASVSPMVRRLAARRGIDLARVIGSGPGGRITTADVLSAADGAPTVEQAQVDPGRLLHEAESVRVEQTAGEVTPISGPAAALVGAMEASLAIPTATSFRTIAVDLLDARRRQLNAALFTAGRDINISFTHIIAYALARAATDIPAMTTSFIRGPDGPKRQQRGLQLGLAVDTRRKDGARFLVVPVIRDAASLDFAALREKYEELVARARAGTATLADLSGATMTLTNPGGIGTIASVPRLMSGQGTIVASGAIGYPPGLGAIGETTLQGLRVGKIMTLTSTYDHRIIQGAESGEFLRRIEQLLNGADGFYDALFSSLGLEVPAVEQVQVEQVQVDQGRPLQASLKDVARGAAAMALLVRYRTFGHTAADLDPLEKPDGGDPALDPASLGLTNDDLARLPAKSLRTYADGKTLADVFDNLRKTYAGTMAYEIEHIANHEQRNWLREQIETGAHRKPLPKERRLALLDRLSSVEAFERYLRRAFLGQKTFSIEGLDGMVPMLDRIIELLGDDGVGEVDIGMAHRGRLSVITHIIGWPFDEILREFEHAEKSQTVADVTGDVKYHQGASGVRELGKGRTIALVLAHNPSHLEAVDSVVEGRARAAQTDRSASIAKLDAGRAAPLLIHGDAAFTGQGTVAEVFNMQSLAGYTTGGTFHIIANNQIGFTTVPSDARSTRYASDLAKGFDAPIVHVNADDVEACISAAQLAVAFRRKFKRDVVIDLIGYRRFGHNETDEPAYTLPLMYERIKGHEPVREIYARRLVSERVLTQDEAKQRLEAAQRRVAEAHERVKAEPSDGAASATSRSPNVRNGSPAGSAPQTRIAAKTLKSLNDQLVAVPKGFNVNPKLVRQLERRGDAVDADGEIDWGLAEALAYASLLLDAKPIRLTGQDTERGTFSQRHLGFYDAKTGERWIPLQHIKGARASFEVYNSPLSELACVGFEYGYSAAAPDALVLWEAQFGDFVNGAQIIVDQYLASGMAKWNQTSRLVLLLPHGYEGAGPEHSSARLERFLQLAADGNFRIANCSTPAQSFHLVRDQALSARARPLVMMTPKSLLRLKASSSRAADLTDGRFEPCIDDPAVSDRSAIRRVILCSGKIYYDLAGAPARARAKDLAIVRVELLEPFPLDDVLKVIASYPKVATVTWVQEEPKNQGARAFVSRRLRERLAPEGIAYEYVGRPDRASTSEGYPGAHAVEQARIVAEALAAPNSKR